MRTHVLKCWPGPFQAIWESLKTFELRRDDRGFKVWDALILREWEPDGEGYYTGREVRASVPYLVRAGDWPGLKPGYVVMGLRVVDWIGGP